VVFARRARFTGRVFGSNLAATQQSAGLPFPFTLGGTTVTMNGLPAPLVFVSAGQINAQVPSGLPLQQGNTIGPSILTANVVVTTGAGVSAPVSFGVTANWPGIFAMDGSGCGPAAALNTTPSAVSINAAANSAAPGDYITLFGTGFGLVPQQPPDGMAGVGSGYFLAWTEASIDGKVIVQPAYAGLAPTLPGVDQVNFQIPAGTRNGCAVPVRASQVFGSPAVTISVQGGRGQCTDPPIQSYGQVSFNKSVVYGPGSGPATSTESFTATFPSGPGMQPPAPPTIVLAPRYVASEQVGPAFIFTTAVPIRVRSCPVPGYSHLSAGSTLQVSRSDGIAATVPSQSLDDGVSYGMTLPTGFIGPGGYSISGTAGGVVGLQGANVKIGSPITITSSFSPDTVISESKPLTVTWTGGDAGTLVKVALISERQESYSYADAASGSLTISPACAGHPGIFPGACTFGINTSTNAQVSVQVLPAPDQTTSVQVPGVTGPVQLTWQYSYSWQGLTLGQ
jgi:uncharacterized protein (TIGR03437 family)